VTASTCPVVPDADFDVIVVGGGVAGAVCAYRLATAGRSVALIERGAQPGSKNLSGGVLYCRPLAETFPGFVDEAPIERRITRNNVVFLEESSFVGIDYWDRRLANPVNAVSVLRGRLDAWLVQQCEDAGVTVLTGVQVDELLLDGDRIVGIRAGQDEISAAVVVAADGVNSFLARQAGLRPQEPTVHLAVGVKSVIGLDPSTIEDRFGVDPGEGAAYAVVGDCTRGAAGGGFIYTNSASVSVGVVLRLDDLVTRGLDSAQVHEHFLGHPAIARLLRGGELLEYGAHLTIEDGPAMARRKVSAPGLLIIGDAAGFTLNTGLTIRGMDLSAASAVAAATAIDQALSAKDVSGASMGRYRRLVNESFAGADLSTYAKAPRFMTNPRLYQGYGGLLADVMHGVFSHDGTPRRRLARVATAAVRSSGIRPTTLVRDGIGAVRSL
jgi:electron transfer flavoprotein-quinone oxidoreductase